MSDDKTIRLDQFLKLCGAVGTGGQAKMVIQEGLVTVNGAVETRRRKKLQIGDEVEYEGEVVIVDWSDDDEGETEPND